MALDAEQLQLHTHRVTGLIGANEEPEGLAAVVSQESLWDMYNYLFSNGVPRPNVTGTPSVGWISRWFSARKADSRTAASPL